MTSSSRCFLFALDMFPYCWHSQGFQVHPKFGHFIKEPTFSFNGGRIVFKTKVRALGRYYVLYVLGFLICIEASRGGRYQHSSSKIITVSGVLGGLEYSCSVMIGMFRHKENTWWHYNQDYFCKL